MFYHCFHCKVCIPDDIIPWTIQVKDSLYYEFCSFWCLRNATINYSIDDVVIKQDA